MGRWYKGVVNLDESKLWSKSPNQKYWVSEFGDLINAKTGYELEKCNEGNNYTNLSIKRTGYSSLHRLVYASFIGDIPEGMVINHIDGVKTNNHISNLEVCTQSENTIHAYKNGLANGKSGEDNSMAKLSERNVKSIYELIKLGYTNSHIGCMFGVHERYVSLIRHGKRWGELFDKEGMVRLESTGNLPFNFTKCCYIAAYCASSDEMSKDLAIKFGIDKSTISRIRNKKTWKVLFENLEIIESEGDL